VLVFMKCNRAEYIECKVTPVFAVYDGQEVLYWIGGAKAG